MSQGPSIIASRKLAAAILVSAVSLVLAVKYTFMIQPAAAREITAACNGLRASATNPVYGELPAQAIDFAVTDWEGKTVRLSDFRGKVVFVNFWATWCNVCRAEKPGLERMARLLGGDDFVVLSLASDLGWDEIRAQFPAGSALQILLDPPEDDGNLGKVAKSYGIKALPESFLVDREGVVRAYYINKRDWSSDIAETCLRSVIES